MAVLLLVHRGKWGYNIESYATGNVAGLKVGGLAGLNFSSGTITNSYSTSSVEVVSGSETVVPVPGLTGPSVLCYALMEVFS